VENLKTIFMGTSDFAVPSLQALAQPGFEVVCVVTQPDRPAGRGMALKSSPVKQEAGKRNLPVFQPEKVRATEAVERLKAFHPDLIVVASYGQMLPVTLLQMPRLACLNVHASLLPKYRGAAPIHYAVMAGDKETGVTLMYMNEKMDEGDILLAKRSPIGSDETVGEVHDRLALLGAEVLLEGVSLLRQGRSPREPQNQAQATYAPSLKPDQSFLDWKRPARDLHNQVRGLNPWPGAKTRFAGDSLHLFRTQVVAQEGTPGSVLGISKEGICVAAGNQALLLKEIQPPGKKRMNAYDFTLGHPILKPGALFT